MSESITEIKNELKAASLDELPSFIEKHRKDERKGIRALVISAENRLKKQEAEKQRLYKMYEFERKYEDYAFICGVDEAGRGPLAGPVVAGAVILPKDCDILYLNDSKKLSAAVRERLYDEICEKAVSFGVGCVSHERIDEINILNATYEAMKLAIADLDPAPDLLLNDAVRIPSITIKQVPLIKGDAISASIAAASIIAKVTRDRMMQVYDELYPAYGFAVHKGYGTTAHIEAIRKHGPTEIHRKTFLKNLI